MSGEGESERDYLERRAEMHRAQATAASDAAGRALHERFAALYAARAAALVQED